MIDLAMRAVRRHPDIGALGLECTNFVPFSQRIREVTTLPVFDLYTLVRQTYFATTGTEFGRA